MFFFKSNNFICIVLGMDGEKTSLARYDQNIYEIIQAYTVYFAYWFFSLVTEKSVFFRKQWFIAKGQFSNWGIWDPHKKLGTLDKRKKTELGQGSLIHFLRKK